MYDVCMCVDMACATASVWRSEDSCRSVLSEYVGLGDGFQACWQVPLPIETSIWVIWGGGQDLHLA